MKILAGIVACVSVFALTNSDINNFEIAYYVWNTILLLSVGYVVFGKN